MLFEDTYQTISEPVEALFKDKGSKFIGCAFPVYSEQEAKAQIEKIKLDHPKATHHCFAYKLGLDNNAYRVNDDGEPSNTAGKPILGQIQSNGLTNILVVVVRYFGGTLLGIGGLINAYRTAALLAIKAATIIEKTYNDYYEIHFAYEQMNEVMTLIKREKLNITAQNSGSRCEIAFFTNKKKADRVYTSFNKIPNLVVKYIKSA